ncbi:hypothetical protein E2986_10780 [Frieseomelitta varia]|uniref:Uncharacterized protein n=1 Tax=Frieseomelitta varia TaxID=561572 RepID=A0A833RCX9_9HYME|nr:hypothetical protein E2986_10780 [Frieseomelitta varia]
MCDFFNRIVTFEITDYAITVRLIYIGLLFDFILLQVHDNESHNKVLTTTSSETLVYHKVHCAPYTEEVCSIGSGASVYRVQALALVVLAVLARYFTAEGFTGNWMETKSKCLRDIEVPSAAFRRIYIYKFKQIETKTPELLTSIKINTARSTVSIDCDIYNSKSNSTFIVRFASCSANNPSGTTRSKLTLSQ